MPDPSVSSGVVELDDDLQHVRENHNAADVEDAAESAALLDGISGSSQAEEAKEGSDQHSNSVKGAKRAVFFQEARVQLGISLPVAGQYLLSTLVTSATLAFIGHNFSVNALAAASIANSAYYTFIRLPLLGLAGALDTKASQAYGAGNLDALPVLFQRCVLFLLAHGLPMMLILIFLPNILRAMGQPAAVCAEVVPYKYGLMAAFPLELINRPVNRILVAQRITRPQLYCSIAVLVLHIPVCALLFLKLNLGPAAGGWSIAIANLNTCILQAAYVAWAGLQGRVWGQPKRAALLEWWEFSRLAHPAALMDMAESFCWGLMGLLAGLLPDGAASVAAVAVAMSIYGVTFMPIMGFMIAAATRVGNALGAGDDQHASLSARVSLSFVPFIWAVNCLLYLEPHIRPLLIGVFTSGSDPTLARNLQLVLITMVVLNLPDGVQMIMGGIFQGCGKQGTGVLVNFVGQFMVALPTALVCAFALHLGVVGLVMGLVAGVSMQAFLYGLYLRRIRWHDLSQQSASKARTEGKDISKAGEAVPL